MHQTLCASKGSALNRRHALNEGYFEEIDTEEKAYMLGYLATDGSIGWCGKKPGRIVISVKRDDREHLETVLATLGSGAPIFDSANKASPSRGIRETLKSVISICSVRMAADLGRHGIHPNKTFTVKPWDGAAHLMSAYIRGCVDGDGWVSCDKAGNQWRVRLGFCGNRFMVNGFADFCESLTGVRPAVYPDENIWAASVSGSRRAQTAVRLLYENATIALPRKMAKAQEAMKATFYHDWSEMTKEELSRLRAESASWVEVADKLGITVNNLHQLKRGKGVEPDPDRDMHEYQGETLCVADWARRFGMQETTLRGRLKKEPFEQAILPTLAGHYRHKRQPSKRARLMTLDGVTMPRVEWAKKTGIPVPTIQKRQRLGWTDEESLTTPPGHPRPSKRKG